MRSFDLAALKCIRETLGERSGITSLMILCIVASGDTGMTALARHLGVSTAAVTGICDSLERLGVTERKPHPHDRRRILIGLSLKGEDLMLNAQTKTEEAPHP